uniref:Immunoglobulin V-set domain-containing protein n=1 Tax=Oreochromis niloticus TaxID=8128 RepID=A0A669BCT4_ORENI
MRVNSSAEIMCTTSLANPMGLYMHRRFHKEQDVVYLDLNEFSVTKDTISNKFKGRINVSPAKQITQELRGFTFQLSLLELEDTNLYYCEWIYTDTKLNKLLMTSNGTVIIVRGEENHAFHYIQSTSIKSGATFNLIVYNVENVSFVFLQYKKKFRPAVPELPPRSERLRQTCSCHHHSAYLVTSLSTDVNTDFRGLL